MRAKSLQLSLTPWTVTHQAPLFMGLFGQEYWSGLPFPSPGDLPTQGLNPGLLHCRWILYWLSYKGSLVDCGIERGIGRGINKDISGTEF